MSYSFPYSYEERTKLLENVRSMPIRSLPPKHDPVKPLVDKLCLLIEKHEFIASDTTDYKVERE